MIAQQPTARFYKLDPALVSEMQKSCRAQTDQSLMDQFGISWNTWAKVRNGGQIRKSTALRLVSRVLRDQGRTGDPMGYLTASDN